MSGHDVLPPKCWKPCSILVCVGQNEAPHQIGLMDTCGLLKYPNGKALRNHTSVPVLLALLLLLLLLLARNRACRGTRGSYMQLQHFIFPHKVAFNFH